MYTCTLCLGVDTDDIFIPFYYTDNLTHQSHHILIMTIYIITSHKMHKDTSESAAARPILAAKGHACACTHLYSALPPLYNWLPPDQLKFASTTPACEYSYT